MKVYINKEYSVQYTLELSKEEYEDLKSDNFFGQIKQLSKYEYNQDVDVEEPEVVNVEVYTNDN